ncbi:VOC family protein [Halobacillus litoralis]|uniref:VOC family protein n=1 Tax=Halobacillus litoralis TaxID=45668 RepID=UPI001CFD12A3|nr:VOC family protein [Halobacillus litoralis]WLR48592.1 VOC family protein [Halobacillus litoralis]
MKFPRFNASQIRIARPTDQFENVIDFYEAGLGLERLTDFAGHRGYEGVVYGLPGLPYQLEFTRHESGSPCPAPSKDNLLVFYIENRGEVLDVAERLHDMGYQEVESENPYWEEKGITIEDPDGWRVVLMNTKGI